MASKYVTKTLKLLRDEGWKCQHVEKSFSFHSKADRDLFGIIDILAIKPDRVVGIQVTSQACKKAHVEKIYGKRLDDTKDWLASGSELWLIFWKKKRKELKRVAGRTKLSKRFYYEPNIEIVNLESGIEVC